MLTLVWDVDDVLNDLMHQWFHCQWMPDHPECRLRFEDLSCNPPHAALGVSREEYLTSMDLFRRTNRAKEMEPNPEVVAWFFQYGARFRHVALTARPLATAPDVASWVFKYFGLWIRTFGVVPSRHDADTPLYDLTKGEYLRWLRSGDVLIDDSSENISQAAGLGMRVLQPAQPWNNSELTMQALLHQLATMPENR
ncbi:hypothetical protein [Terriglobus albidus]|uniref:hypothetical protein n=1 Tax=Terriglobus albidus TaxID=1592106 RepID=UPI0021E09D5D|nr:hypothetical protein [Terriglobus albidus]